MKIYFTLEFRYCRNSLTTGGLKVEFHEVPAGEAPYNCVRNEEVFFHTRIIRRLFRNPLYLFCNVLHIELDNYILTSSSGVKGTGSGLGATLRVFGSSSDSSPSLS